MTQVKLILQLRSRRQTSVIRRFHAECRRGDDLISVQFISDHMVRLARTMTNSIHQTKHRNNNNTTHKKEIALSIVDEFHFQRRLVRRRRHLQSAAPPGGSGWIATVRPTDRPTPAVKQPLYVYAPRTVGFTLNEYFVFDCQVDACNWTLIISAAACPLHSPRPAGRPSSSSPVGYCTVNFRMICLLECCPTIRAFIQ
jgi:hypothetical protein